MFELVNPVFKKPGMGHMLVIPLLGSQSQVGPWGSPDNYSGNFLVSERPRLKGKGNGT